MDRQWWRGTPQQSAIRDWTRRSLPLWWDSALLGCHYEAKRDALQSPSYQKHRWAYHSFVRNSMAEINTSSTRCPRLDAALTSNHPLQPSFLCDHQSSSAPNVRRTATSGSIQTPHFHRGSTSPLEGRPISFDLFKVESLMRFMMRFMFCDICSPRAWPAAANDDTESDTSIPWLQTKKWVNLNWNQH